MPKYRIMAQEHPKNTLGYLSPDKQSSLSFTADPKKSQEQTFTLPDAQNWLNHIWYHLKNGWGAHPWFKGRKLNDVRLVVEEVSPDGKTSTIVAESVNWANRPTVSSGGTTP
jgi:hypothetical protein